MQNFARPLRTTSAFASLKPEVVALAALGGRPAIGNAVHHLAPLDPALDLWEALPRAADAILLPVSFAARSAARPIYGRAPDAKPLAS